MKFIEMSGKTVDEALDKALKELNASKESVSIEIIDEGSRGFFNIIGTKQAKIKVTVKRNYIDEAKVFIDGVLKSMKIEAVAEILEENDTIKINLIGNNMGTVIGYRGETLDALQYLISLVINKNNDSNYKKVILDTENYRFKREETLKRVALKSARRVKKTKKKYKLEPMNPYERRIIHAALQDDDEIKTHSEGDEPYRRVVIDIN